MERFKQLLRKIFVLPALPTLLISIPAFASVICVFVLGMEETPLAYVAFVLSAYAAVICTTGIVRAVRWGHNAFRTHPLGKRYLTDVDFRTKLSLLPGLLMNLAYVGIKLASGIRFRSVWFLSVAVYYLFLALMRFPLLRHLVRNPVGQDRMSELRKSRLCGILLLLMNQALCGIVVLMVVQNRGYDYPGMLIYVMAAYSFYSITVAIIGLVKYRRYGSPVLLSVKVINLTAAAVSILSLETAMLTQFGQADGQEFRRIMTAATGAVVCLMVLGLAVYMIVRSAREYRRIVRT